VIKRFALVGVLLASPAMASLGPVSDPLDGFQAEQVDAVIIRNPADAIGADPRFEAEQVDPSIEVNWTRGPDGHLWADVTYRNPDTGIFSWMNERFEFAEREDGDWDMVGRWKRWKCLESASIEWTTERC